MQDSGLIDFNPQPPKEEKNETAGEKDAEEEKLRLEAEELEKKEAAKLAEEKVIATKKAEAEAEA